ncbi:MAG: alpha/beta hydrolase [Phycisphaeraceae bacterium]
MSNHDSAAPPVPLWPGPATNEDPSLAFLPAELGDGPRPVVIVCPGGGYNMLAEHEGEPVARRFNREGFHAAVLRYRVAPHRHPAPIHDIQRAVRLVREHAGDWGVNPGAVAVLGFSAGGHLCGALSVHHARFTCEDDDLAERHPARPDAAVLCYAVTSFTQPGGHSGSGASLLGEDRDPAIVELMNLPRYLTPDAPPTFLWHTADDAAVPLASALEYAGACRQCGVPVELHVYESGRHGLGLAEDVPDAADWTDRAATFLRRHLGS